MTWTMPPEGAPHERTWMTFPRAGETLGATVEQADAGRAAWAAVANAVAALEPVSMLVDPSETATARRLLDGAVELHETPVDEFWMRDSGPTFVLDPEHPDALGAVDWIFNGWGAPAWAEWQRSAAHGRLVSQLAGAERIDSLLVNEGGGIHVDGEGTVLLTDTVQLDPRRNPFADRERVEAEMQRAIGARHAVWLPRGLTRDYDDFGTNGHVDIVAAIPAPGQLLLHAQPDPAHPDHAVMREIREAIAGQTDAAGRSFEIVELPAPATLSDVHGFVDFSYVNHYVLNGGVIACGFGEPEADARAAGILAGAYPGREVVTVDAREIFARGGGIHCITQQQPAVGRAAAVSGGAAGGSAR